MPEMRSVHVMTLGGEQKGVFQMPPRSSLVCIDEFGYAYARENLAESTVLRKYKLLYNE